ncbi:MAG: hypothetical protein H8K06_07535 [Nitrospira sp.]|nr:hypothetical protein [Nitrospira sp.]
MSTVLQPPTQSAPAPTDINDWNNTAMNVIASALGMVPEVGSLLSGLVYILWPSEQEDVWDEIKDQVQALVQQDLTQLVENLEAQTLKGLKGSIQDYQDAITTKDPSNISQNWTSAKLNFVQQMPQFQTQGYEVALLPYYAQAVNLYLALLRDGVLHGTDWGWTDADVAVATKEMNQFIQDACQWVDTTFGREYGRRTSEFGAAQDAYVQFCNSGNDPINYSLGYHYNVTAWNDQNNFLTWMTLKVLDFRNLWPFCTSGQADAVLHREIYSAVCGSSDYSPIPVRPWWRLNPPAPIQPLSTIEVFAGDRIDGVRLAYPPGGGPGGQTQVVGGALTGDTHATLAIGANPLVAVSVSFGDIVGALQFDFLDGTFRNIGRDNPPSKHTWYLPAPHGEIISSIYIHGTSEFYQSADLIIIGYQYQQKTTADLTALRHLYIVSPSEIDLPHLAARCVTKPVSIETLTETAKREGWDTQRQQYRAARKPRASAAKASRRS